MAAPTDTAEGPMIRPVKLDELPTDKWRETLTAVGFNPSVLSPDYSPGQNLSSKEYKRTDLSEKLRIRVPAFDPTCYGRPLLWNNGGTGNLFGVAP